MKSCSVFFLAFALRALVDGYSTERPAFTTSQQTESRRAVFSKLIAGSTAAAASVLVSQPAFSFEGSGSSVSSGYNPASALARRKAYQDRVVADMKDFNRLGASIAAGETSGSPWVSFFIQFPRKQTDDVGRSYAALCDFRGVPKNPATAKKLQDLNLL